MPSRMLLSFGMAAIIGTLAATPSRATEPASVFNAKKTEVLSPIPLRQVAATHQNAVKQILDKPTITARSQPEAFAGDVDAYRYFLDSPDRAVTAWRKIGAKCVTIQNHGNQQFSWTDENGSEVAWRTVLSQPDLRVWYAEGKVKAGPLLPLVPVKVVVALRYSEVRLPNNHLGLQHHTEMAIHTDSKTAVMVTKMLGPQAQRMAEQGLGQFQFFFGGLSFYVNRNPEQAAALMPEVR